LFIDKVLQVNLKKQIGYGHSITLSDAIFPWFAAWFLEVITGDPYRSISGSE